jgi:hypothetical protein
VVAPRIHVNSKQETVALQQGARQNGRRDWRKPTGGRAHLGCAELSQKQSQRGE